MSTDPANEEKKCLVKSGKDKDFWRIIQKHNLFVQNHNQIHGRWT